MGSTMVGAQGAETNVPAEPCTSDPARLTLPALFCYGACTVMWSGRRNR